MLAVPRFRNIDLPIYRSTDGPIARSKPQLAEFAQREDKFLRRVNIIPPNPGWAKHLAGLLEAADQELLSAARFCGSTVVGHAWGLYRLTFAERTEGFKHEQKEAERFNLPKGHVLVAEVDSVRPAFEIDRLSTLGEEILHGKERYRVNANPTRTLADIGPHQFVSNVNSNLVAASGELAINTTLVDIEPRFRRY